MRLSNFTACIKDRSHCMSNTPAQLLNERAHTILKVLIEQYLRDGQPVGSKALTKTSGLKVSSATIRNVMGDLEDKGLLHSPHTSAGRVPTHKALRLFVDSMVRVEALSRVEVASLYPEMDSALSQDVLLRHMSEQLSQMTQMAGLVTLPRRDSATFRQIEFVALSGQRLLVIVVSGDGEVHNSVAKVDRDYTPSELEQAANYINSEYRGIGLSEVRDHLKRDLEGTRDQMQAQMQRMIELAGQALGDEQQDDDPLLVSGQTNLMNFSELSDMSTLRDLFEAFNRKRDVYHLLESSLSATGVKIFIGKESGYRELDDCSIVAAPYAIGDDTVGAIGVIGPTRMNYERVIPIVDITSKLLGAALNSKN